MNEIKKIKPHVHAKGGDRKLSEMPERETVLAFGGKIVRIPYVKDRSTTKIIDRVLGKNA